MSEQENTTATVTETETTSHTETKIELVQFETITETEEGAYRVAFEGRTAWNGVLEIETEMDEEDEPYNLYAIAWREPDDAKKHRVFPLVADEDGHVVVEGKAKWGRLVRITPKS